MSSTPTKPPTMAKPSTMDMSNVQGDIWPGLPKKSQTFLFFRILNPVQFKKKLEKFASEITTAERVVQWQKAKKLQTDKETLTGVNIAFTSSGLEALGKYTSKHEKIIQKKKKLRGIYNTHQLIDDCFGAGMYADLVKGGWDDPQEIRELYKPVGEDEKRQIDGVIMVTSKTPPDVLARVKAVQNYFGMDDSTVHFHDERLGRALRCKKEHFGFVDGISQPQIAGLDKQPTVNEPEAVKLGMILSRCDGDPLNQPKWAEFGSFLVIRDLQQLVPEFNNFLKVKANEMEFTKDSTDPEGKLAAHLMGRWKNGTPVHMSSDEDMEGKSGYACSNAFDYSPKNEGCPEKIHEGCPFGAHIRKMRPRKDLGNDHAVILRRGISYGPDVSDQEKIDKKSDKSDKNERGLLFVCYQSDIRNGFNFLTTQWASDHTFPGGKLDAVGMEGPGIDPIVGQRLSHHPARSLGLPDGNVPSTTRIAPEKWVVHRGGEYFFSPSIDALKIHLTGENDYPDLDDPDLEDSDSDPEDSDPEDSDPED